MTKQSSSVYNKFCMKIFADVLQKYSSKSGGESYETREKTAWQIKDACRDVYKRQMKTVQLPTPALTATAT